jgi:hypothetical protein
VPLRLGLSAALGFAAPPAPGPAAPPSPPPPPPPPPPVETSFLIVASDQPLVDEHGNHLVWELS